MKAAALWLALGLTASPLWAQTAPDTAEPVPAPVSDKDPFERGNRAVYRFNDSLDKAVVRPVAEAYVAAVPEPVRTGVGNFFGNIGDVWSTVNKLLQGKVVQGAQMTLRVATNTVFGLGGVLDPATEMGLERQSEDFGQTLGFWGVPSGPYLVLPLFGPSTLRDAAALPLDKTAVNLGRVIHDDAGVIAANGLQLTQTRSELLGASKLLGDVSLDPYAFLRDAYLARRRNLIWDGDPPDEDAPR